MEQQSSRDIRIEAAADIEAEARTHDPRPTCEECSEVLPKSVRRPYCVVHSPYVQGIVHELVRRERRLLSTPTRRVA